MQGVPEFQTASDLMAHYAGVKQRLRRAAPWKPANLVAVERFDIKPADPIITPKQLDHESVQASILSLIDYVVPDFQKMAMTRAFIMDAVIMASGLPRNEVVSQRRKKPLSRARQVYYYLSKRHTSSSFPEIGRSCCGRDHSTVLYGVRKVEQSLADGGVEYSALIADTEKIMAAWLQRETLEQNQ